MSSGEIEQAAVARIVPSNKDKTIGWTN